MDAYYVLLFILFGCFCAYFEMNKSSSKNKTHSSSSGSFQAFKNNYLVVYSLMMAGDWLQGPYVYALYQSYGYNRNDIGKLFIAGFGSAIAFAAAAAAVDAVANANASGGD